MTSLDLRDVLNLPADGTSRPTKKSKPTAPRQNLKGLAREVQSLGGDNPIAIVPATSAFKKRRLGSRKPAAKWRLEPFKNSARESGPELTLRHWKRVGEPGAASKPESEDPGADSELQEMDDSSFAKYSVQVQVPQYSVDQYNSNLQNDDWTKEETDYLLRLARDFDLRWSIIWDRYDYRPPPVESEDDNMALVPARQERDIDDLKARYYEVAAKMMAAQTPVPYMPPQQQHLHNVMANYSPQKERARRKFAIDSLSRSKEEAKEEESLLLEVKRILARAEQLNEQRKDLYARLDYPATGDTDLSPLKTSEGLQKLLQTLMSVDKTKKRKSILENGASPSVQTPGPESAGGHGGHSRRDSIVSGHGRRDSVGVESAAGTPTTSRAPGKKGSVSAQAAAAAAAAAAQQERRRLTDIEEIVYGVTHHDRLTGGATFRYEKINKLFSHKSGQQQARITNVLTELGIPPRLQMPTSAVVSKFENLIAGVNALLDSRKISDRLDADLKTETVKRQYRLDLEDRAKRAAEEEKKKKEAEEAAAGGGETTDGKGEQVPSNDVPKAQAEKTNGDAPSEESAPDKGTAASKAPEQPVKQEGESRLDSSGRKRSASVMSTADEDKAAKRQKKL